MTALRARNYDLRTRRDVILAFVLLVSSALLRFWGLKWGLPNELHDYSYHPDEFLTVGTALAIAFLGRVWNPGFYNYPSLYPYMCAVVLAFMGAFVGELSSASAYLSARIISAAIGTAAVLAVFWAGSALYDKRIGLLAGTILCVAPLHVQHSHFAAVDVPSTLFVALALGFSARILRQRRIQDYLLAGSAAGLAAGTKYNAGLVLLSPIAAHLLQSDQRKDGSMSWELLGMLLCAVVAFLVSTPGSVSDTSAFVHGVLYELRHSASGHGLVFAGTGSGFVYTFRHSIIPGLGIILACLFFISIIAVLAVRDRPGLTLAAFVIPYYGAVSMSQVRFARYILPILPAVAILIAWTAFDRWRKLCNIETVDWLIRMSLRALCLVGIVVALVASASLNVAQSGSDPRDEAARWVFAHIPKGSIIGVVDWPWFYSPPYTRAVGFGTLPQRQESTRKTPYQIVVLVSRSDIWRPLPRWVVMSDYEIEDALRLADCRTLSGEQRRRVALINRAVSVVRRNYRCRAVFGGSGGLVDWQKLPHDMRYTNPRITIYELRK
ncbi:MAG: glycosyltransferase family 39 protein [Armatimonadota bacterium]|nr:glycosyltransferase family 39 protein [Armatimonadota bacterium]